MKSGELYFSEKKTTKKSQALLSCISIFLNSPGKENLMRRIFKRIVSVSFR
jgi:hypothetical protein